VHPVRTPDISLEQRQYARTNDNSIGRTSARRDEPIHLEENADET
jgi:hypothetical protein